MARDIPNQPYNYIPVLYQQYATNEADKFASIWGEVDNNYGSEFALGSNNPIGQMPVSEFNQNENGTLKITDDGTVKSPDIIDDEKVNGKSGFDVGQIYNMIPWNNWYDGMKGDRAVNNLVYGDTSQDPFARLIGDVTGSKKSAAYNTVWSKQQDYSGIRNNYNLLNAWNPNTLQQTYADQGWGRRVLDNLEASGQGAAKGASFGGPWGALIGGIAGGLANIGSQVIGYNQRENLNKAIKTANQNTINSYYTTARNNDKRQLRANMSNSIVQNKFGMGTKHYKYGGNLMRGNIFDEGGEMGGFNSFGNGVDMFNVGGSHEENMYGGIPQGMAQDGEMNYVQEGEVKYNDYIYSNELTANKQLLEKYHLPKRYAGKDIATIADKLQEDSEERPNDSISKKTLDINMERLKGLQEEVKQKKQEAEIEAMFAQMSPQEKAILLQQAMGNQQGGAYDEYQQQMGYGDEMSPEEQAYAEQGAIHGAPMEEGMPYAEGGILIKPSKRGTFTAAATKHGMGVQEFANQVLAHKENYSPAMVKKAVFAHNFGGHKHDEGGPLDGDGKKKKKLNGQSNNVGKRKLEQEENDKYMVINWPLGQNTYQSKSDSVLYPAAYDDNVPFYKLTPKERQARTRKDYRENKPKSTADWMLTPITYPFITVKDMARQLAGDAYTSFFGDNVNTYADGGSLNEFYNPAGLPIYAFGGHLYDGGGDAKKMAYWWDEESESPFVSEQELNDFYRQMYTDFFNANKKKNFKKYYANNVPNLDWSMFNAFGLKEFQNYLRKISGDNKEKATALADIISHSYSANPNAKYTNSKGKSYNTGVDLTDEFKAYLKDKDFTSEEYNPAVGVRHLLGATMRDKANKPERIVRYFITDDKGNYTYIDDVDWSKYRLKGNGDPDEFGPIDEKDNTTQSDDYELELIPQEEINPKKAKSNPNPYTPKPYYDWIPTAYNGKMLLNDLRGPDFTLGTQLRDIAGDFRYTAPGGLTRERYNPYDINMQNNQLFGRNAGIIRGNANTANRATQAAQALAYLNAFDNEKANQNLQWQQANQANRFAVDDFNNKNAQYELSLWDNAENRNQKVDELKANYRGLAANADDQSISNWNKMRDRDWQAMLQYQADMDKERRSRDFILANADLFNAPEDFEGRMPQYYSTPWGWWGRN